MRLRSSLAFLLVLIIAFASAWPCERTASSVTELANFNSSYEFPCMYSGLIETDATTNSNMFYWFFLSPKPDYATKLVLWFTGGPGDGGQESIFDENGPLKFRRKSDGTFEVISDIKNSFVDIANVIYVDQPLGVGYSYTDVNVTAGKQIGDTMVQFMLKFYELYPEQRYQELIVAGNSYGGHYVPVTAKAILDYNANLEDKKMRIPMTTIIAEGGYVDPLTQRLSIKDLAFGSGLATLDLLKEYEILEQKCEASFYASRDTAFEDCKAMVRLMNDTDGGWDIFDVRYSEYAYLAPDEAYDPYFRSEEVQKQLHVIRKDNTTIPYILVNETIYHNIRFDGLVDYTYLYDEIVTSGIATLVYTASFDGLDGALGTQRWLKNLNFTKDSFASRNTKNIYYYTNAEGKETVGGSFKVWVDRKYNKLSYANVYAAGHQIGNTQILTSKAMLQDMMTSGKISCHRKNGYCTTEQTVCYHMNNCNKNGQCMDQRCVCNELAFGADCSIVPTNITSGTIEMFPRQWIYFKVPVQNQEASLKLATRTGEEVHVYHKVGDAPSRSDFDGFKKSKSLRYVIDASEKFTILAFYNPSKTANITVEVSAEGLLPQFESLESY